MPGTTRAMHKETHGKERARYWRIDALRNTPNLDFLCIHTASLSGWFGSGSDALFDRVSSMETIRPLSSRENWRSVIKMEEVADIQ